MLLRLFILLYSPPATSFIYITGHMSTSTGFRGEKTCEKKERETEQTVKEQQQQQHFDGLLQAN